MYYVRLLAGMLIFLLISSEGFAQSLQLADSLNRQGMGYYKSGNYRQAEFYLGEAFQLYEKQAVPAVWLPPGFNYAEILVDRSKYNQARALFKRLNKVAVTQSNIKAQARIENDLGWIAIKMGDYDRALKHLKRGIPLAEEAKDSLRLGYIYNNIGSVYYSRGEYDVAISSRKKALVYKKQTGDLKSISISLNNLGLTYKKLALYDKAIKYYNRSLAIRKKLGNADLLGSAYNNTATLFNKIGLYDQALIYYQQGLEYAQKAGNPVRTALTLNNIGTLYGTLGQTDQELAYYRQSLKLKEKYANAASLAVTYSNIADRYLQNDQPEEAFTYYQQALKLRRQAGNPRAIAASLLALAHLEIKRTAFARSVKYIARARAIADSTEDRSLQLKTRSLLGRLAFDQGRYGRARSDFKEALSYGEALESSVRVDPLINLAYTYNKLGSDSTIYYGRQAIRIIEAQRSQIGPISKNKASYLKRYVDFYKAMAGWQLKFRDDVPEAYHYVQLAKTRALNDELASAAQRIDESLPEKVRIKRNQRRSEISHLYSQRKHTKNEQKVAALSKKIRQKELSYASFENRLAEKYPKYKSLKSPEPVSLQQVRDMCDGETAVLEYAVTDQYLVIFFISRDEARAKRVSLHEVSQQTTPAMTSLAQKVNQFRQAILAKAPEDSLASLSAPLYQSLMAPFQKQLAGFTNLMVVPDSYLAYLPFEALKEDKHSNYLVSKYNIKYEPSMTGFSYLEPPQNESSASLLAIGNAAGASSSKDAPLLPSVGVEMKSIGKFFNQKKMLDDREVTEAHVKKLMSRHYAYIHIAAHSVIDEKNSFLSGIMLNQQEEQKRLGDDGYLRSSEIYGLNIPTRLVVLSACKSGMGNLVHGEGLLGLQRAFLNAGAAAVMVSLWDVYDRSTARFMTHFYRSLLKQQGFTWSGGWRNFLRTIGWDSSIPFGHTAAALRATKLSMLHSPAYHHPVYWAPFVMMGR